VVKQTAYIVKYWATQGIFPLKGRVMDNGRFVPVLSNRLFGSFEPGEYALSTNEAVEKANALREELLQALQQTAERLIKYEIKVNV